MSEFSSSSERTAKQSIAPSPAVGGMGARLRHGFTTWQMLYAREKKRVREEIAQVPGLMALLMKPRNGQKWSETDRAELSAQFRRLSRLGLYLATAVIPGTSLTLPLLAWWLDQRHGKRT